MIKLVFDYYIQNKSKITQKPNKHVISQCSSSSKNRKNQPW